MKTFVYKWQAHPFDMPREFTVSAASQEEANQQAKTIYQGMFDRRETVMLTFYPQGEKQ